MTVNEIIYQLQNLSDDGLGEYVVCIDGRVVHALHEDTDSISIIAKDDYYSSDLVDESDYEPLD